MTKDSADIHQADVSGHSVALPSDHWWGLNTATWWKLVSPRAPDQQVRWVSYLFLASVSLVRSY